jgi:hypothetical protein
MQIGILSHSSDTAFSQSLPQSASLNCDIRTDVPFSRFPETANIPDGPIFRTLLNEKKRLFFILLVCVKDVEGKLPM